MGYLARSGGSGGRLRLNFRCLKEPLDGWDNFDRSCNGGSGWKRVEEDQKGSGFGMLGLGFKQRADFALEGGGVAGVGADLDVLGVSRRISGVEIHFVALGGAEVMDLATTAQEFDEHGGFEGVAEVVPADPFVDRDEARIDRIGLAGVDHALALGGGEERGGPDQEGVFEVGEEGMEAVLGNGQALGFQRIVEFLDAEGGGGVSEEMTLEPAEGDGIGNATTLDDVAQDGDIDIALQERPAVADVDVLGIRKAAIRQVGAKGFFEGGAAGLGQVAPSLVRQKSPVEKRLAEAERKDRHFHGPSAHAGMELPAEHGGR